MARHRPRAGFTLLELIIVVSIIGMLSLPGTARVPWPGGSALDQLGFAPEGTVRFQYAVGADDAGTGSGTLQRYTAEATADLDGNGQQSFFAYVRPAPGAGGLDGFLPGTTCLGTGVVGPGGAATVLRVPGPCDTVSGRSRF